MSNLTRLWNPRSDHRLHRHWVAYNDLIIIAGERPEQFGVLAIAPSVEGALRARLNVSGIVFEEVVEPGNDVSVWINGLELFVGIKAVEDGRLLAAFGIPRGAPVRVNVSLDDGLGEEPRVDTWPEDDAPPSEASLTRSIGIAQTRR